jgi:hypothetical protein
MSLLSEIFTAIKKKDINNPVLSKGSEVPFSDILTARMSWNLESFYWAAVLHGVFSEEIVYEIEGLTNGM